MITEKCGVLGCGICDPGFDPSKTIHPPKRNPNAADQRCTNCNGPSDFPGLCVECGKREPDKVDCECDCRLLKYSCSCYERGKRDREEEVLDLLAHHPHEEVQRAVRVMRGVKFTQPCPRHMECSLREGHQGCCRSSEGML